MSIPLKKYFIGISRNTILLALASLFSDISTEMLYPIFPIFLTQTLQASGSVVGLIDGMAKAIQNIMQGFSGWLSDKSKKPKLIALVGYFVAAVCKPIIGFSSNWQAVLGARFIERLGTGIRSAPRDAMIASSVEAKYRGRAFGLEGLGDNLGACLGPLITVFLLFFIQIPIRYIFYLTIIPGLLAFFTMLLVNIQKEITLESKKLDLNIKRFSRNYWKYIFVISLLGMASFSTSFLILQTHNNGISTTGTILIYMLFNLSAAAISYPAGYFSDKVGRKNVLLFSFICLLLSYIGFALTKNTLVIIILFILYGLYQGIFRSVGKALVTDFLPNNLYASGVGWFSAILGLLQLVASIIAGVLWDHISHTFIFVYGVIFSILAILALVIVLPSRK